MRVDAVACNTYAMHVNDCAEVYVLLAKTERKAEREERCNISASRSETVGDFLCALEERVWNKGVKCIKRDEEYGCDS